MVCRAFFVVWWFGCLVSSRAYARDTGAALLIRGGGALGVETPAHEGWRDDTPAHKGRQAKPSAYARDTGAALLIGAGERLA